jgi:hypothetical protein
MMEYWNDGRMDFQRNISILEFLLGPNTAVHTLLQSLRAQFSIIPEFHHSNRGEA